MDLEGGFNQQDSEGFIRINAIRLMAHHEIMRRKHLYWGAEPDTGRDRDQGRHDEAESGT